MQCFPLSQNNKVIEMAQYEIKVKPLADVGDRLNALTANMRKVQEQLDTVRTDMPKGFDNSKQQISATFESVSSLGKRIERMNNTLQEVTRIYKSAEQAAFNDIGNKEIANVKVKPNTPLRLRPQTEVSQGVVFLSDLVLPDWLQMAVLRYEQTRL
jgi:chromosome segregation ATPase